MNKSLDISYSSINMLQNKFAEYRKSNAWVPDWGTPFEEKDVSSKSDVLLMGRYFERIFQLEFWPKNDFNLFCLSPQIKEVLVDVFSFDSNVVGHISRYELFPIANETSSPFKIHPQTHFYHAGRISGQKNIEFLIFTIFYLQIFYSSEIKLSLIGHFDNDYHRDLLGCQFTDYSFKINKIISELPWPGEKPIFIFGKNEAQWPNYIPDNGLFFSASNLISEDFSVTCAQLQQLGKPLLIPRWAGFKDVQGENVKHYDTQYLATSNDELAVINLKAKKFAQMLMNETQFESYKTLSSQTVLPEIQINQQYLQEKIELNKKSWGKDLEFLINKDLPQFSTSEKGQIIFKKCRAMLSR